MMSGPCLLKIENAGVIDTCGRDRWRTDEWIKFYLIRLSVSITDPRRASEGTTTATAIVLVDTYQIQMTVCL